VKTSMKCEHDPRTESGPIGQYHCPECGEMVLAGFAHPDHDEFDRHLGHMAALRPGDLVGLEHGHFALVLEDLRGPDGLIRVAVGNGVEASVPWTQVRTVHTLPGSDIHANFAEWLTPRSRTEPLREVQSRTPEEGP
jgi:hypothetical protein